MRFSHFLAAMLILAATAAAASAQELRASDERAECVLLRDPTPSTHRVLPPHHLGSESSGKTASFVVNFNPLSCPTGATATWPQAARDAFQYAVDIWAAILNGTRTIEVDACWRTDLATNILGSAGATVDSRNFSGAPQNGTWYPVPLANQLADDDLNGSDSEITANFSSVANWYFGTDGNPGSTQTDFVSVVVHEIGHGLGISGRLNFDDGALDNNGNHECNGTAGVGCLGGSNTFPRIYDTYTENNVGSPLLGFANNSTALGNQLVSNAVFFDSPTANTFNGGNRVQLFAPTTWVSGSSYSHVGEIFEGTDHALMTNDLSDGEVVQYPGTVVLGMLADMGWDIRNLTSVWVDLANTSGIEVGSAGSPFNTVFEGITAVYDGGQVIIREGSYDESLTILRDMTLEAATTGVVVGQ